ncbi:hypothetical protein L2E82_49579 [Cichorium intybus]|uniref:Uncharacterized protein n=1 Tax=Cichorium intybus TaxID=13427 RepID=A0ACB8Z1E8_CICIN|nr:hypothetical protein L2E82_49579 [Cichorium intybus]
MLKNVQEKAQDNDHIKEERLGKTVKFEENSHGLKTFQGRVWVPLYGGKRELILEEAHKTKYSIHPRCTNVYGFEAFVLVADHEGGYCQARGAIVDCVGSGQSVYITFMEEHARGIGN